MYIHFLTIDEPFVIILIVPIIHSIISTSKDFMRFINHSCLSIFVIFYIFHDYTYLEPWILLKFNIFLILDYIGIRKIFKNKLYLTEDQINIYKNFSEFFTQEEFILFFNSANIIKTKSKIDLLNTGDPLKKIYYFAEVPNYSNIHIKYKDTILSYIKSDTWIGLIEFILLIRYKTYDKYLIDLHMEKTSNQVTYYEWDLSVILYYLVLRIIN